jgi:Tol biopolymer transport system component
MKSSTILICSISLFIIVILTGCDLSQPLSFTKTSISAPEFATPFVDISTNSFQSSKKNLSATKTLEPTVVQPTNTPTIIPTISWQQGKIAYMTLQESNSVLNFIDLENNSNHKLTTSSNELGFLGLSFSPDGESLAYYAYPKVLNVIRVNSKSLPQQIATCQSPSFSADGSQILCVSSQLKLILINSSNGSLIKQIDQDKLAGLAELSNVSDQIVYTVRNGQNTQIWKTSLNGETATLLAGNASENYVPTWSPDGNQIAYQSNDGSSNSEIWIMDKDGNNKRRVTFTSNNGWSRGPSWSPDGQYLAYVSNQNGSKGSDLGDIFIVSLISGDTVQATFTGGVVYDWKVAWGN